MKIHSMMPVSIDLSKAEMRDIALQYVCQYMLKVEDFKKFKYNVPQADDDGCIFVEYESEPGGAVERVEIGNLSNSHDKAKFLVARLLYKHEY